MKLVSHLFVPIAQQRPQGVVLLSKGEYERHLGDSDPTGASAVGEDVGSVESSVDKDVKIDNKDKGLGHGKAWADP